MKPEDIVGSTLKVKSQGMKKSLETRKKRFASEASRETAAPLKPSFLPLRLQVAGNVRL